MLQILFLPIKLLFWLLLLPFKLVLGLFGMVVGTIAFLFQAGLWLACIALAYFIGTSRGLNPLLCIILGMFGPIGLLIVVIMALARPARGY
jgi:hypothetical protein